MAEFIPAGDDARKSWAAAFKTPIRVYGTAVGLTAANIQGLQDRFDHVEHRRTAGVLT